MGTPSVLWSTAKKCFTVGVITLTVSDRFASILAVRGASMSPTFNLKTNTLLGSLSDDYVLVEKFCLIKYKFSHGDVIVFRSPFDDKEKHVKRIVGLPGDMVGTPYNTVKIPEGHCWVEGDDSGSSMDSRSFGPVSCSTMTAYLNIICNLAKIKTFVRFINNTLAITFSSSLIYIQKNRMGRLFVISNEGNAYSCKHCQTHLALLDDIISKSFHCRHGKAYLFDKVVNITAGEKEERMMLTGMHTVVDIFCVGCGSIVGWKYESAHEKSQKYKEGKFILERFKVLGPDGSNYDVSQEALVGGSSDADDA
ncbi:hypothetical protein REPUB_Repub06bG0212000 [Reevesia pubescens]